MYIYVSEKSLGFCSENKNLNQNKKLWLSAQTETKSFFACPTCHSLNVSEHIQKAMNLIEYHEQLLKNAHGLSSGQKLKFTI